MEKRIPKTSRRYVIKMLDLEESKVKTVKEGVFEVKAPTGTYTVAPTRGGWYDVRSNDVRYRLSNRQAKITLHAESRCGLEQFAREFGVELDPELAKDIWIIPDAVFCDLGDDITDFKEGNFGIVAYLNAAKDAESIIDVIDSTNKYIGDKTSSDGQVLFSDLLDLAKYATFVADTEKYIATNLSIAKLRDEILVIYEVLSSALRVYVERSVGDISAEKIYDFIDDVNEFKLKIITTSFNYAINTTTSGPMDLDTNDPILGFGLITADYETSYYDLVQMMFYDTDVPKINVVRGIRVPLALLVDEFRSCETESMNATEYVIREMSRTMFPYEYYKVGIDWYETYQQYEKNWSTRTLTDSIYVFRDKDVTVDSLSEQLDEMEPNPASEELKHLLGVIKEDCWYDVDEYVDEEEGDDEEDDEE